LFLRNERYVRRRREPVFGRREVGVDPVTGYVERRTFDLLSVRSGRKNRHESGDAYGNSEKILHSVIENLTAFMMRSFDVCNR
jgi:hypothetical protein